MTVWLKTPNEIRRPIFAICGTAQPAWAAIAARQKVCHCLPGAARLCGCRLVLCGVVRQATTLAQRSQIRWPEFFFFTVERRYREDDPADPSDLVVGHPAAVQ